MKQSPKASNLGHTDYQSVCSILDTNWPFVLAKLQNDITECEVTLRLVEEQKILTIAVSLVIVLASGVGLQICSEVEQWQREY